jgi:hypothetical protein
LGALEIAAASGTILTGMGGMLRENTVGDRSNADIRREPAAATVIIPNTGKMVSFSMRGALYFSVSYIVQR